MSSQPGTGTSEVSKKLKAAIRAKLEELGVYVDDELPDYIMVMIANKKEKVQMKDDLNLFIGKSTAKFVDWLFDLFDRLQNASSTKQGESSSSSAAKKDDEKQKEQEAKEQEEKRRKEKEERDRELQKEKEKERERQRERDRAKRLEEEKRREEKRKEASKPKRRRTRSRSNTYSDDERLVQKPTDVRHHRDHRQTRSVERKRPSAISSGDESPSPVKRLQSKVTVHRNIRPTGESSTAVKGRGTMFLRALNEASVSSSGRRKDSHGHDDDDMSDVEALPSKAAAPVTSTKKSVHERLSRVKPSNNEDDDTVVLDNQPQAGGPQMILKLSGGREAIKKARIQDRIVLPDDGGLRRGLLKRRVEMPKGEEEPTAKHERIKFDISRDTTPSDDSPTMQKWNGHIRIGDDSDEEDDMEEAEIDAMVAEARGIPRRDSAMEDEEEIPATHHLSGAGYPIHITDGYQTAVPAYIPTPLSVLNEQQNQMGVSKDQQIRERCVFWPKCTKKEACQFAHPTTNCKNFPNCSFGNRCLFIHPNCRFDRYCTKKHCPFTHPGTGGYQPGSGAPTASELQNPLTSNRAPVTAPAAAVEEAHPQKPLVRGALGNLAEKLAASIKKKPVAAVEDKKEEKTDENEAGEPSKPVDNNEVSPSAKEASSSPPARAFPDVAPLQSLIPCRYAGGCRNPICHFKHPKECRFGTKCRNPTCYFYHKPAGAPATAAPTVAPTTTAPTDSAAGAKYKWTASAAN